LFSEKGLIFEIRHEQPKIWIKQLYLFASKICYNIQKGVKTLEEKMLALMEKLYKEFKSLDGKVGSLDAKVGSLDAKVGSLDAKVGSLDAKVGSLDAKVGSLDAKVGSLDAKVGSLDGKVGSLQKDVLRIENKLDTDSKALFDGYSQTYEKLGVIETKVDAISSKVEKQDVEIRVIKGAK